MQRDEDWFRARCGHLTASRAADVLDRLAKGGVSSRWIAYANEILTERITGTVTPHFETEAMRWGTECEEYAREEYMVETGNGVTLCDFILHPSIAWFGASPDGLVGDNGLIEIKCPNTATHLNRFKAGVVLPEYKPQMLVQLLVTGRKWVDFVDYDPRLSDSWEKAWLFIVRYEPTQAELDDALAKCKEFLAHVEQQIDELRAALVAH